jgi:hypothetical protein
VFIHLIAPRIAMALSLTAVFAIMTLIVSAPTPDRTGKAQQFTA